MDEKIYVVEEILSFIKKNEQAGFTLTDCYGYEIGILSRNGNVYRLEKCDADDDHYINKEYSTFEEFKFDVIVFFNDRAFEMIEDKYFSLLTGFEKQNKRSE